MKKIIILALFAINFISAKAQNADFDINILMNPAVLALNANGVLQVSTCNNGSTSIVANSIRITVTVGTNAEILGLEAGSDNRWTILNLTTGTNNTMQLKNTGGTMTAAAGANPCANINLTVKAKVNGGPSTITGTIGYITGANSLLGGAPSSTQGNTSSSNDNSTTSLNVSGVLPVKLASFDAVIKDCNAELKWTSASEINFNFYAVEYSNDGIKYDQITTVSGKGDNKNYTLLQQPQKGKAYYRLKLVDKDNNFSYSKINLVNVNCTASNVTVYPNPVSNILHVNISDLQLGIINGILFDESGRKIISKQFKNGTNNFDVSKLAKGNYTLALYKTGGVENIKIFKY